MKTPQPSKRWVMPHLRRSSDGRLVPSRGQSGSFSLPTHIEPVPRARAVNAKTFELAIAIPKLNVSRKAAVSLGRIWYKSAAKLPKKYYALSLLLLVVGASGSLIVHGHMNNNHSPEPNSSATAVKGAATATGPTPGTPNYATIVPGHKTIAQLGGWFRISPPDRDPVYAFVDHVGTVEITVSEQPLPDSFQKDTAEQIAKLAQSFSANQKLTIASSTAYIGTSAKGPQSVIYTKDSLLILIKSADKLTDDQWAGYVSALQ